MKSSSNFAESTAAKPRVLVEKIGMKKIAPL